MAQKDFRELNLDYDHFGDTMWVKWDPFTTQPNKFLLLGVTVGNSLSILALPSNMSWQRPVRRIWLQHSFFLRSGRLLACSKGRRAVPKPLEITKQQTNFDGFKWCHHLWWMHWNYHRIFTFQPNIGGQLLEAKFADQLVQAKENFSEFQLYRSFLGQLAAMDDSQSEEMYSIFLRRMKSKYQTACLVGRASFREFWCEWVRIHGTKHLPGCNKRGKKFEVK